MGETGLLVVVVEVQSAQAGSLEVLTGATGLVVVVVEVQSSQAPPSVGAAYGQLVTVGPQEVMVTSSVTVTE